MTLRNTEGRPTDSGVVGTESGSVGVPGLVDEVCYSREETVL